MTTAQQQRRPQPRQRRKPLPPAETMPPIVKGREQLRRFSDACDAYATDMAAAFTARRDTIGEAWADYERKRAEAEAEYDRAHAAAAAAYEQRTAGSHKPEPEAAEPADAAVTE